MRKSRSLISIALVASMALSLAGCAGGGAFGPAALAKYAKGYGAELYTDYEDWQDDLNGDDMPKGLSDGIYVNAKGDDVKEAVKKVNMCTEFYDKTIKEATVYIVGKEKKDHEFAAIFFSATSMFSPMRAIYANARAVNCPSSSSSSPSRIKL